MFLMTWRLPMSLTLLWVTAGGPVFGQRPAMPAPAGLSAAALRASRNLGGSGGSGARTSGSSVQRPQSATTGGMQSPGLAEDPPFCDADAATDMSMEGFRTAASFANGKGPCVILLFGSWTLRTRTQFNVGCLFSACLGLMLQATADILRRTERSLAPKLLQGSGAKARVCVGILHFVQMSLAYLCMLVAMTYQAELFFAVCAGLSVGHVTFGFAPGSAASVGQSARHQPCCSTEPSAAADELSGADAYKDLELRRVVRGGLAASPQE